MFHALSSNSPALATPPRILAVVDWAVDPHAVVAALSRTARAHESSFVLAVPAWLHGMNWVGDPTASVPCATQQRDVLVHLCGAAGVALDAAMVGDPDPITAAADALRDWPAAEIILCARKRHFAVPPALGLASRLSRVTVRPVTRVAVPQRTATSPPSANGGTSSIRSPLQKRPGSYQLAGRLGGSRPMCW